jgi:hypothetical protein
MEREKTVSAVCRLAQDFAREGGVSMLALLRRSGYSEAVPISEERIEAYLRHHPELVESWLMESRNTRGTPAWYLLDSRDGGDWTVGYYPGETKSQFRDKFKACAFYVQQFVRELSDLASRCQ